MTLSQIAKDLEAAIVLASDKKAALDAVRGRIAQAESDYAKSVDAVRVLHAQHSELIAGVMSSYGEKAILTSFGQVHK